MMKRKRRSIPPSHKEPGMSETPLLQVEHLEVRYGAIEAIKGISLYVRAGEIVTIIGGNGAGKSTLMKTISGLEAATVGKILFAGQDITRLPGHLRVPKGIAQSPEGRQVFPDQSVLDNLLLGAYHRKDAQSVIEADVEEMFTVFPRLRERQEQMAGTMSGGEQQMLAIARALMARPRLLLMDEPSLGLAPLIVKEIFAVIRTLKERGVTILLVEQMANQALAIADRAYVLETGRITLEGSGSELRRNPKVRAAYLGDRG
jgi:branched-chain amino acid transport system ATP-binding protein